MSLNKVSPHTAHINVPKTQQPRHTHHLFMYDRIDKVGIYIGSLLLILTVDKIGKHGECYIWVPGADDVGLLG